MEKKMSSILVTRNADGSMYFVCDPTTAEKNMAVCATGFKEGKEPDSLIGSLIAMCSAAGEDPLETAVRLAEYIIDDEKVTKRIKDYVLTTFREAVGAEFFGNTEEPEPDHVTTEDENVVKDFLDYLKGMLE